jgi:hypothetical protein
LEALETLLRYLSVATNWVSGADLRAAVEEVFLDSEDETMTMLAEKWAEKWVEDGVKRGLQQGLQQGLQ